MQVLQREFTLTETQALISEIINAHSDIRLFVFSGNLGAGKTHCIRALCAEWGATDSLSSPSFGLLYLYQRTNSELICHADLYRLQKARETEDIGLWEYIDDEAIICCIEWPELILDVLPRPYLHFNLEHTSENTRTLKLQRKED